MRILTELPSREEAPYAFTLIFKTIHAVQCRQLIWDTHRNRLRSMTHRGGREPITSDEIEELKQRGPYCYLIHENPPE